jgi:hypothetical protein
MYYSWTNVLSDSTKEWRPVRQIFFHFSAKIKIDLYIFDVAESKNVKQPALPPTTVKWESFRANKYLLSKKRLIYFKIDMYSSKRESCIFVKYPT